MVVLRLPHFSRQIKCIGEEDVYVIKCQQRVKSLFARLYKKGRKAKKSSQTATAQFWQHITGSGEREGMKKPTTRKRMAHANATV